jgi:uncharacterized membrane protein
MKLLAFWVSLWLSLFSGLYVTIATSFIFVSDLTLHTIIIKFLFGFSDVLPGVSKFELIHMQDVRILFFLSFIIWLVSFIFWLLLKQVKLQKYPFKYAFAPLGLLVIGLIFFNHTFILFHQALFTNMYWIFPPESWIIGLYPIPFFAIAATIWFCVTGILMYIFSK